MVDQNHKNKLIQIIDNIPSEWIELTTHRLDIYNEDHAKVEFLNKLESLSEISSDALRSLPTAFDYIRLGHPLSCILEWSLAKIVDLKFENVISFSSKRMPLHAILRKNLLLKKSTNILIDTDSRIEGDTLQNLYKYNFKLFDSNSDEFNNSDTRILLTNKEVSSVQLDKFDFIITEYESLGSIIFSNDSSEIDYISEILHVRRRESIAMTPHNCLKAISNLLDRPIVRDNIVLRNDFKLKVSNHLKDITLSKQNAIFASSGLSIQYAIMMGLIDYARNQYPDKKIKFIVPPNCYGGTNDQARRVCDCFEDVDIVDLPVDSGNDMSSSLESILNELSQLDSVPFIIAEIPTNPRVEVPNLEKLQSVLEMQRKTKFNTISIQPTFVLDQTFCPNYHFLKEDSFFSNIKTISYVSGSKFPSGGLCTAGYSIGNEKANILESYIIKSLDVCDNYATELQLKILSENIPTMTSRIERAFLNTQRFVNFISQTLPDAKINFVDKSLSDQGFMPSVFSLDLPTKGTTLEARERFKRDLNLKLIKLMIESIPEESKHCVSYGQLKGCYWTIPATSTQGTTKEGDKDYIVRVSIAPDFNLDKHKEVFAKFVELYY